MITSNGALHSDLASLVHFFVVEEGLEPSRLSTLGFESSASAIPPFDQERIEIAISGTVTQGIQVPESHSRRSRTLFSVTRVGFEPTPYGT